MPSNLRIILVHLDATAVAPQRLDAARQLALQHASELVALYAVTPSFVEMPYAPDVGPMLAETLVQIDNARRASALKAFDEAMTQLGPVATWTQTDEVPIAGAFAQQARYADLLVLGQHAARDEGARCVPPDFVAQVLVASGRPALVIPNIGWQRPIGSTVAIAWKGTPEAARAVHAALPFLQKAAHVHVFTWGNEGAPRLGGAPLDLPRYLHAHGVDATFHHERDEPAGLGELLLSRVFDVGADLLVTGCYGHSRAREWILGGVSRTLLDSMTLPLLMSH